MWLAGNRNADSRFRGCDSFRGLPDDWTPALPRGAFDALLQAFPMQFETISATLGYDGWGYAQVVPRITSIQPIGG